eukprot:1714639-Prymnesium_polylepis.1
MALLSHHGLWWATMPPVPSCCAAPPWCGLGRPMRRRAKALPYMYRPYRCHTWNAPQHRRP